jgi:hypothetical protein
LPRRWIDASTEMDRLLDRASIAPMNFQEQRLGLNEAVFREVNERIEGISKLFRWSKREPLDLVCECRNATCVCRIQMSRADYEALRSEETHFALYPGHADTEIERVIASRAGYEIVAKRGPAAEVARDLSRR